LKDIKGIEFVYLSQADVVRHHLVTKIIQRYEHFENQKETPPQKS
jgi:phosphate starvation-inducible PhoH-like protein